MDKCNVCAWLYDESSAGLINCCGNEELTEEEHEKHRNQGQDNCPGYTRMYLIAYKNWLERTGVSEGEESYLEFLSQEDVDRNVI